LPIVAICDQTARGASPNTFSAIRPTRDPEIPFLVALDSDFSRAGVSVFLTNQPLDENFLQTRNARGMGALA